MSITSSKNLGEYRKAINDLETNINNVNTTLTNKINTTNTTVTNNNTTLTNKITTLDNTCQSTYLPKNAKYNTIIQKQNSTSNYTHLIQWESEGITYLKNKPHIGHHNSAISGDAGIGTGASGAIILVPYSTDADPWGQGVGLYIGKNTLKLDGNTVRFVKTTYTSGATGYRVWSDGFIEQWGTGSVVECGSTTITLPKAMTTTNYNAHVNNTMGLTTGTAEGHIFVGTKTTTTLKITAGYTNPNTANTFNWSVRGY